jgi:hypothetical protein
MFGSEILEVAIGVIFVFILVSIICSAIREGIETWLKTRSAYLEYGIRELLHDRGGTELAKAFYNHPLIHGLFQGDYPAPASGKPPSVLARGGNLPSYIPARNFALALMDIAARGPVTDNASSDPGAPAINLDTLRTNIFNLQNQYVQRALLASIDSAGGDLERVRLNLEAWYDSSMDRVSGWYKRSTQWILLFIGFFVAVSLNVNTLTIASYLFRNDAARANLAALAESRAGAVLGAPDSTALRVARAELGSLNLPIGWSEGRRVGAPDLVNGTSRWRGQAAPGQIIWNDWIIALPGWLLTALAATMGAPFWFDVLNKVMVIRSTVKPHEKSPEESSEDRQSGSRTPAGLRAEAYGGGGGDRTASVDLAEPEAAASPPDEESGIDACGADPDDATLDEELPVAEGGVA